MAAQADQAFASSSVGSEKIVCIGIVKEVAGKTSAPATAGTSGGSQYRCNGCRLSFISETKLQIHLLESHINEEAISCTDCGKRFQRMNLLNKHVLKRICTSKPKVPCAYCAAPFPTVSKLRAHLSTVHGRSPKTILCETCGAVFTRRGALQKHATTFHPGIGQSAAGHRCPLCPAVFRTVDNLQRHLASRHANWKRWLCSLCTHQYNHSIDFKRHLTKKHGLIMPKLTGHRKKGILDVHVLPALESGSACAAPLPPALAERRDQLRRLLAMVPSGQYDPQLLEVFAKLPLARPGIKQAQPGAEPSAAVSVSVSTQPAAGQRVEVQMVERLTPEAPAPDVVQAEQGEPGPPDPLGPAGHQLEVVEAPLVLSGSLLYLGRDATAVPLLLAPPPPPPPTIRLVAPAPTSVPVRRSQRRTIGRRATAADVRARTERPLLPAPPPASESMITFSLLEPGTVTFVEAAPDSAPAAAEAGHAAPVILASVPALTAPAAGPPPLPPPPTPDTAETETAVEMTLSEAGIISQDSTDSHATTASPQPAPHESVPHEPASFSPVPSQPESLPEAAATEQERLCDSRPDGAADAQPGHLLLLESMMQLEHGGGAGTAGEDRVAGTEGTDGVALAVGTGEECERTVPQEDGPRSVGEESDVRSARLEYGGLRTCNQDSASESVGEEGHSAGVGGSVVQLPAASASATTSTNARSFVPGERQMAHSEDAFPACSNTNRTASASSSDQAAAAAAAADPQTKLPTPARSVAPDKAHVLRLRSFRVARHKPLRPVTENSAETDQQQHRAAPKPSKRRRTATSPAPPPPPCEDEPPPPCEDEPPVAETGRESPLDPDDPPEPPAEPGASSGGRREDAAGPSGGAGQDSAAPAAVWSGGRGKTLAPRVLTRMDARTAPRTLALLATCVAARTERDRRQARYLCCVCERALGSRANLRAHLVSHTQETPFHCSACPAVFRHYGNARDHLRKHTDTYSTCETCGRRFLLPADLRRHERTHISDTEQQQTFPCTSCPAVFSRADNLTRHVRLTHAERPLRHTCDVCQKQFKTLAWLKQHTALHTAERPYSCDVCGQRFNLRAYLRRHRKAHDQPRVYCELCPRRFHSIDNLTMHRRIFHRNPVPLTAEEQQRACEPRPDPPTPARRGASARRPHRLSVEIVRARRRRTQKQGVERPRRDAEQEEWSGGENVGSDEDWLPD